MKTIQLTHGEQRLDMSEKEALGLHSALTEALTKAGIEPNKYRTLKAPKSVETFSRDTQNQELTDC